MNARTRMSLILALAAILAFSLAVLDAGCAGREVTTTTAAPAGSGTSAPPDVTTTESVSTDTSLGGTVAAPIKIGAPLPLTGAYATDGEDMQMGLEMAVADLNSAGGLLGRPVELQVFDIEGLLSETVAASKSYLVDQEKVDVVIEGYGGYGPDFEAYGANCDVPFIHGSGSVAAADLVKNDPTTYGNMFQVFPVEAEYGKRAWEGVVQFQGTYAYPNNKIAILHGKEDWDLKYSAGVVAEAQKAGWHVAIDYEVPYGTTDWGPVLAKIRAEQPAAIVCSILSAADISSFVTQFMEDPTPSLIDVSYMVTLPETQEALGNDLKGMMGYVNAYVASSVEHDAWKSRFKEMFGIDVPLTNPPSAYDSVMLWAEAVKVVGDPAKHAEIQEYIKAHRYTGLLGTYDFNNPEQTIKSGPDFPIAYSQYLGDGKLAFFGTDQFIFPRYIQPAWAAK